MAFKYPLIKPELGEEELDAVRAVFASRYLTEGPVTHSFESDFAAYCGVKHAIAFTSCTTALETALRALGVGAGDEVIVPDFTHPATAQAVYLVGATPVLVDIDKHSYNIDYDALEAAITPKTKALMPVSIFGNPLDYTKLNAIKQKHNVFIVEDAACSIGSARDGAKVGSCADISCFSLHPRKVITTGEGGMATTDSDEIAKNLSCIKRFGMKQAETRHGTEFALPVATNYKLSNILGAIGHVQLKKTDTIVNKRIALANNYNALLAGYDAVCVPAVADTAVHNYQSYCILLNKTGVRNQLIAQLREEGIEAQIGTYALSLQPAFADTPKRGSLENSHYVFENSLTLPLAHDLTDEDQRFIVETLKKHLG